MALFLAAAFGPGDGLAQRQRARIRIAAGGDLLLHIKLVAGAAHHGWPHVFESLAPLLRSSDIAFANLETPLVDDVNDVVTGSPPVLGAPAAAAPALAAAGFDVLGCANNHAYDQKAIGLERTLRIVQGAEMACVGAAKEENAAYAATWVERSGKKVAFLGVSHRLNRGPGSGSPEAYIARMDEKEKLNEAIARARVEADVVVLAVHWSHDFAELTSWRQKRLARGWVDAGVDLVIGTGPHVLQSVTRLSSDRGDAIVAYSLGNLVSNQGQRWEPRRSLSPHAHPAVRLPETRDGALLRVSFEWRDGSAGGRAAHRGAAVDRE